MGWEEWDSTQRRRTGINNYDSNVHSAQPSSVAQKHTPRLCLAQSAKQWSAWQCLAWPCLPCDSSQSSLPCNGAHANPPPAQPGPQCNKVHAKASPGPVCHATAAGSAHPAMGNTSTLFSASQNYRRSPTAMRGLTLYFLYLSLPHTHVERGGTWWVTESPWSPHSRWNSSQMPYFCNNLIPTALCRSSVVLTTGVFSLKSILGHHIWFSSNK